MGSGSGPSILPDVIRGAKSAKKRLIPEKPSLPKATGTADLDAAAAAAAERERQQNRRRGRASTILTGPLGDLSTPSLGYKVLTGS